MGKLECEVIIDLLPIYIDGLSNPKTNRLIEDHLKECKNCKAALELQTTELKQCNKADSVEEEKVRKQISNIEEMIALKTFAIWAISIMSIWSFFSLTPNHLAVKIMPAFIVGAVGCLLYRRYLYMSKNVILIPLVFFLPIFPKILSSKYHISPKFILDPLFFSSIGVIVLISCGYLAASGAWGIYRNRKDRKQYIILGLAAIVLLSIYTTDVIGVAVSKAAAKNYVDYYYPELAFSSIKFNREENKYFIFFTDTKGEELCFKASNQILDWDGHRAKTDEEEKALREQLIIKKLVENGLNDFTANVELRRSFYYKPYGVNNDAVVNYSDVRHNLQYNKPFKSKQELLETAKRIYRIFTEEGIFYSIDYLWGQIEGEGDTYYILSPGYFRTYSNLDDVEPFIEVKK
jgi:hypothetical protein